MCYWLNLTIAQRNKMEYHLKSVASHIYEIRWRCTNLNTSNNYVALVPLTRLKIQESFQYEFVDTMVKKTLRRKLVDSMAKPTPHKQMHCRRTQNNQFLYRLANLVNDSWYTAQLAWWRDYFAASVVPEGGIAIAINDRQANKQTRDSLGQRWWYPFQKHEGATFSFVRHTRSAHHRACILLHSIDAHCKQNVVQARTAKARGSVASNAILRIIKQQSLVRTWKRKQSTTWRSFTADDKKWASEYGVLPNNLLEHQTLGQTFCN